MATESQTPTEIEQTVHARAALHSRGRIFFLLFTSFLLMIAIAATAFGFVIHSVEDNLRAEIQRSLSQKALMFASDVNSDRTRNIATVTSQDGQLAGARATVVDMNGKVIADSEVRVSDLDDEGRSPEFAAALRGNTGIDVRARSSFAIPVLYVAVPVSGGAARLAYPLADLNIASSHGNRMLATACGAAVLAALVISALASAMVAPKRAG